ncbi:MAG: hypothetical protein UU09_C0016G0010 [Microgenomates group bacterium GW2011_GWA2_40_6]|nr:MAG: hypothetical protein UU09_C0016G0010 [Microgenomates group bacterium GW2011_GWA2_40_6]
MWKLIQISLILVFFLAGSDGVKAWYCCSGGETVTWNNYYCAYSYINGTYSCEISSVSSEYYGCWGWANLGCFHGGTVTSCDATATGCNMSSSTSGDGGGSGGCNTLYSDVCSGTPSCSGPSCGGSIRSCSCTAECGNTYDYTEDVGCNECGPYGSQTCGNWTQTYDCSSPVSGCLECVTCSPQCGQATNCSGICSNADAGAPPSPVLVSPIGSLANPVVVAPGTTATLVWNSAGTSDYYDVQVLDMADVVVWSTTTVSTSVVTGSLILGNAYSWQVRGVNTTCGTEIGNWSSRGYFRLDDIPHLKNIVLKNSTGNAVAASPVNYHHICQSGFYDDPQPRLVTFEITIEDLDGWDQITSASMRWNGLVDALTLTTGAGTTMVVTLTKNYAGYNDVDTLPLEFDMADIYTSSGWVASNQYWKVWDCKVNVAGIVYDGSAGQACNTIGFSQIADINLGFDQLIYKNMSGGADVVMGVAPPASYSGTDLIWNQSYLPIFNGGDVGNPEGDIAGSARFTRGIDLGVGTTHCADYLGGTSQFAVSNIISPYSTNTQAQIDFSYIRDQESWFQVEGGGIKGRNEISSGVPVTATFKYLTMDNAGIGVSNNGIVASMTFRNSNGYNDSSQYGSPNNWRIVGDVVGSRRYSYSYLYGQYFTKLGEGVTNTTIAGAGSTGVVFISGNLTISSDVTVPVGKFLMVVVIRK